MPKKKTKISISTILIALVFFVGASTLLYPTVSNIWNLYRNSKLISEYDDSVKRLSEDEREKIYREAKAYNDQHRSNTIVDAFTEDEEYILTHPYDTLLNPSGNEVMGSIEIPKIRVNLAIYHGIGAKELKEGCGHVEGTSLPIGGKGTHSVLAAHRGLPSAKLFTDLDQIRKGDQFYLKILDRILAYEVDQIRVVLPSETEDLAIDDNEDYVTLLTCTPYGVNTHRMLVRGHRVPYVEKDDDDNKGYIEKLSIYIALAVGIIIFFIILAILLRKYRGSD